MQPRRGRDGRTVWRHVDERHLTGAWACRTCKAQAVQPWRFYCSISCRGAFLATVPPFWRDLASETRRRDKHTCTVCGAKGGFDANGYRVRLEVDHIKPVALFPELEFERTNLRTLCHACHVKHGAKPQNPRWRAAHAPGQGRLNLAAGGTGGPSGPTPPATIPLTPQGVHAGAETS